CEQRGWDDSASGQASDPDIRRYYVRLQRGEVAIQGTPAEVRVAPPNRTVASQQFDALASERQRGRGAGKPERQLPWPAGHPQPCSGLRRLRIQPPLQHDNQLDLGPALWPREAVGRQPAAGA